MTGRFQPVHVQHMELFGTALREADHLIVAVTNPDHSARHEESTSDHRHTDGANPFVYFERLRLLEAALDGAGFAGRASVVPFDLTRPHVWPEYVPLHARQFVRVYDAWEREKADRLAGAGYTVTVLDGDPDSRVSASDIRAALASGTGWEAFVPPATVPLLRELR
ncbi:adenylyltransferase/cytidyltransferase family protein [Pseudonocardia endophytica]|uniref:adenylyltransferase/cytidyltransferase family protein n=1 Tax=Pseudonocardia endophytica TaxID=401976 RepID=UPI001FB24738|nr:adenylyltransferase/cytidyltransferase family protein [Pseudonocardia endophytica]